jgi:hypothetical protein
MFFYPYGQFQYTYLLLVSAVILLAFAGLKMTKQRVAWYLSVSAPGILILPDNIVGEFALRQKNVLPVSIILADAFLFLIFCPAVWLLPLIFALQIRKLGRSDHLATTNASYLRVALLASLYPWCDIFVAFARDFNGH